MVLGAQETRQGGVRGERLGEYCAQSRDADGCAGGERGEELEEYDTDEWAGEWESRIPEDDGEWAVFGDYTRE